MCLGLRWPPAYCSCVQRPGIFASASMSIERGSTAGISKLIIEKIFDPIADLSRLEADCGTICIRTPLNDSRDPELG